jgi:hypothetical protein
MRRPNAARRFSETLAAELVGTGVDVNTVAPGAMNTRMLDAVLAAGEAAGAEHSRARVATADRSCGTRAQCRAHRVPGIRRSDGITGRLISAEWDPWSNLPSRREDLNRSDVYTLRRIVPKDRGMTVGRHLSGRGVAIVGSGLVGRKRAAALAGARLGRLRRHQCPIEPSNSHGAFGGAIAVDVETAPSRCRYCHCRDDPTKL